MLRLAESSLTGVVVRQILQRIARRGKREARPEGGRAMALLSEDGAATEIEPCRRSRLGYLAAALCVALVTGLVGSVLGQQSQAGTYEGPPLRLGQGTAQAFVTLDVGGKPIALGVRFAEAALTGLPAEPPRVGTVPQEWDPHKGWDYILGLPREAAETGYTHVYLNWNPNGHAPSGIYDVPHFDVHFYLISSEERERITPTEQNLARARKQPPASQMPAGYFLPRGTKVPRMGAHAINPAADEFNKKPFTKTFVYGFYDGRMIFLEPMIAKAFLETRPNVSEPIKLPKTYALHAYYPIRYSVKYDPASKQYAVSLEGLTRR